MRLLFAEILRQAVGRGFALYKALRICNGRAPRLSRPCREREEQHTAVFGKTTRYIIRLPLRISSLSSRSADADSLSTLALTKATKRTSAFGLISITPHVRLRTSRAKKALQKYKSILSQSIGFVNIKKPFTAYPSRSSPAVNRSKGHTSSRNKRRADNRRT